MFIESLRTIQNDLHYQTFGWKVVNKDSVSCFWQEER